MASPFTQYYLDAVDNIDNKIGSLENYRSKAESATSKEQFDRFKAQYESEYESYLSAKEALDLAADDLKRFGKSVPIETEIPEYNDKNQWLAGGLLKKETFAGGSQYSPTDMPAFDNYPVNSANQHLLNGNFFTYLRAGLPVVQSALTWGLVNTMFDDDKIENVTFSIDISMTVNGYKNSKLVQMTVGSSGGSEFQTSGATPIKGTTSTAQWSKIWKNRFNAFGLLNTNPLSIAYNIVNLTTQEELNINEVIQAGMVGTVVGTLQSVVSNKVTGMVANALGGLNTFSMLGINLLVGALFEETIEVASGLDTSIGYGGDYIGSVQGVDIYKESKGFLGLSTLTKEIGQIFSDRTTDLLTDRNGTIIGSSTNYYLNKTDSTPAWNETTINTMPIVDKQAFEQTIIEFNEDQFLDNLVEAIVDSENTSTWDKIFGSDRKFEEALNYGIDLSAPLLDNTIFDIDKFTTEVFGEGLGEWVDPAPTVNLPIDSGSSSSSSSSSSSNNNHNTYGNSGQGWTGDSGYDNDGFDSSGNDWDSNAYY